MPAECCRFGKAHVTQPVSQNIFLQVIWSIAHHTTCVRRQGTSTVEALFLLNRDRATYTFRGQRTQCVRTVGRRRNLGCIIYKLHYKKHILEAGCSRWYEQTFKITVPLGLNRDYLAWRMKGAQISVTSFIEMQGTVFIQIGKKLLSRA